MTAIVLFALACWFWTCLALTDTRPGQLAIFGPVMISLACCVVLLWWAAKFAELTIDCLRDIVNSLGEW